MLPIVKKYPKNDENINLTRNKNRLVQKWLDLQCTELFIPEYSETLMDQSNNEFTVTPVSNLKTSGNVPIVEIKKNISNPENVGQNFKINQTGENVLWKSIKMIKIEHDNLYLLKYKTSYADTSYELIDTRKKCRKSFKDLKLCALQNTPKISEEKKKDLLALCYSHAIPKNHWEFYQQLEVDSKTPKKIVDTNSET